jgi:hypothetical protein
MLYSLLALTFACVLALCFLPRSLAPIELPALVLDRAAVAKVVAEDAKQAKSVTQVPAAKELDENYLVLGDIENHKLEKAPSPAQQRERLARMYAKLAHDIGEPAALTLRAHAVARLESALNLQLSDTETERVLGMFPEALARHRATQDGFEVAPHFVLRTLYKTRWNIAMGLAPDYKLEPIEKQAFHGWIALHATNLGPEPRLMALRNYAAAGGHGIAEARGVLAFLSHDYEDALEALEHAEKQSPSLRLRNWLRGTHVAFDAVHREESLGRLDSGGAIP